MTNLALMCVCMLIFPEVSALLPPPTHDTALPQSGQKTMIDIPDKIFREIINAKVEKFLWNRFNKGKIK